MTTVHCNPLCPKCQGAGFIYEKETVNGYEALTGRAWLCHDAEVIQDIQGLTGKRFDVSRKEFEAWWMAKHYTNEFLRTYADLKDYASPETAARELALNSSVDSLAASMSMPPKPPIKNSASKAERDRKALGSDLYDILTTMSVGPAPEPESWNTLIAPISYQKALSWATIPAAETEESNRADVVMIHGKRGTGRSSLAGALLRAWCHSHKAPGAFVSTITLRGALSSVKKGPWGTMTENQIISTLVAIPCLVMDEWDTPISDIDGRRISTFLYQLYQGRLNAKRPTIYITDYDPTDIQTRVSISDPMLERIRDTNVSGHISLQTVPSLHRIYEVLDLLNRSAQ